MPKSVDTPKVTLIHICIRAGQLLSPEILGDMMIEVLQNWDEIGRATKFLALNELPRHGSGEKCWDLRLLYEVAHPLARTARIIDLGYSGLHTLSFLQAMGFTDLYGVDLRFCLEDRLKQTVRMWRRKTLKKPFKLFRRDITTMKFADESFDLATCISVLEHNVDPERFLVEAGRILKPGGRLFVTIDYWKDKIAVTGDTGEYGLSWKIFYRSEIEQIIAKAENNRLKLIRPGNIPDCDERCIIWHKIEFSFIAIAFEKV